MRMEERGLFRMAAMVLLALIAVSALAWAVGRGPGGGDGKKGDGKKKGGDADRGAVPEAVAQAPAAPAAPAPADAACAPDGGPRPLDAEIRESSGVAPSRAHAGIFWTHNDSGEPLLYAVDSAGRTVGRVRVAGAAVEDWEDVAAAPCPGGGDCLYVADIGDNEAERPSVTVYRVPEPAPGAARSAPAAALRLRYPDGPQDAEALFVLDGAVHVVTKGESGPIVLYRAPAGAGAEATLERVRVLTQGKVDRPERITGAAASPDGRWIALRTVRHASLYRAAELAGGGALTPVRVDLQPLGEEQGEGIGFAPGGSIVLTSEGGGRSKPATFARLRCTLP
ncbi:MAG TPA: hypothetical protein VFQ45_20415 [Longimicrobium sp.]|nr:hypothetical protein [Longimicrobium sp.]